MRSCWLMVLICSGQLLHAQNVGIDVNMPVEKLDVSGNILITNLVITNGGAQYDFLKKLNATGQVGFRKGHGALGMRYIMCITGCVVPNSSVLQDGPFLSEIKLFAGNFAPPGWMFCEGQSLLRSEFQSLFNLISTSYGAVNSETFKIPDLRGAVPVQIGTSSLGITWSLGEKIN